MGEREEANQHPAPAALAAFLRGELPAAEGKLVLRHLLQGCAECSEALAPAVDGVVPRVVLGPPVADPRYDLPIARAYAKARKEEKALAAARREVAGESYVQAGRIGFRAAEPPRPDLVQRSLIDRLLKASWEQHRSDPEGRVLCVSLAWSAAQAIDLATADAGHLADLQAQVLGELGNAYRFANAPREAERYLSAALSRADQGTLVDPLLYARLLDFAASTCTDLRRFPEAFRLLDLAYGLYQLNGDPHRAGRALITKGLHLGYAGRVDEGIAVLLQGLEMIDLRAEPGLTLFALHNWLLLLVDAGRFAEARRRLAETWEYFEILAGEIQLIKLRGIAARVAAGLGELEEAECGFLAVRADFACRRMPYTAAIVALDLAGLWLRQGRSGEVIALVEETLRAFKILGIRREAIAAFLVLRRAVDQGRATGRLLKSVAGRLQRLEQRATPEPAVARGLLLFRKPSRKR